MTDRPEIARAEPVGPVHTLDPQVPVWAFIRWEHFRSEELPAVATAYTRDAVLVTWEAPGEGLRSDWLPVVYVRRFSAKPQPVRPAETRGSVSASFDRSTQAMLSRVQRARRAARGGRSVSGGWG